MKLSRERCWRASSRSTPGVAGRSPGANLRRSPQDRRLQSNRSMLPLDPGTGVCGERRRCVRSHVDWRLAASLDSEFSNDRRRAQEALAGDEGATALFEAHRREVYRVARAVTGDHEAGRDAVQETFLKVFRGLPRWRGDSSHRTWIVRIAVRTAIDQRRRSSRHAPATKPSPEPWHDPRAMPGSIYFSKSSRSDRSARPATPRTTGSRRRRSAAARTVLYKTEDGYQIVLKGWSRVQEANEQGRRGHGRAGGFPDRGLNLADERVLDLQLREAAEVAVGAPELATPCRRHRAAIRASCTRGPSIRPSRRSGLRLFQ